MHHMPWGIALNSRHPGLLMKTVHKFLRPCVANTSKEGVLLRYSWHVVAHFERKQGLSKGAGGRRVVTPPPHTHAKSR